MKSNQQSEAREVEEFFDFTAKAFDSLYEEDIRGRVLNRFFRRGMYDRVTKTIQAMQPIQGKSILDVGSGSARNSALLLRAGADWVTGVDFSEEMNALARAYLKGAGFEKRSEIVRSNMMEFSTDKRFDYSVALGVFDYIAEPVSFLIQMKKFTTGRVIGSFPESSLIREPFRRWRYARRNCPLYFYTRDQLSDIYKQAGFSRFELVPYASKGLLGIGYI